MHTFETLQAEIKNGLRKYISDNKMSQDEFMTILGILAEAKDLNELHVLVESFADDYEFLNDIVVNESSQERQNRDKDLQILISALIKEDPNTATEVMNYLDENKSASTEQVLAKFPALNNFK